MSREALSGHAPRPRAFGRGLRRVVGPAAWAVAATAAGLAGCAPYMSLAGTDAQGRALYEIRCESPDLNRLDCFRAADTICPHGYVQVETPGDRAWRTIPDVWFDRIYVGRYPRRLITIACPRPS